MKLGKIDMKRNTIFSFSLFITTIALFVLVGGYTHGQDMPFPTYGSGAIQVRIYTDYFCPPCRAMEPAVEAVLRDLIKKNVIRLTLVDTPFSRNTPLYVRYFLYALNAKNNVDHALRVRNILFDAATDKQFSTKENIEELFKNKGIAYTVFDAKPAFDRFNALIKEDNIHATPTCVIVKGGEKEHFIGGEDIVNALKRLQ